MRAAVISAGTGERLQAEGVRTPKPLVTVLGEPLIARALRAAGGLGAESVACIVNDVHPEVASYLRSRAWPAPLRLVVRTTPSSMESLFALEEHLAGAPFLLFTVDVVAPKAAIEAFAARARALPEGCGALALTGFVDDEKPLWARVDAGGRISGLGDAARGSGLVTAGFYFLPPSVFSFVAEARARGLYTVGFAGYDGGAFVDNADVDCCFVVRSQSVHRIQEAQALLGYALWSATHERFGDREVGAV